MNEAAKILIEFIQKTAESLKQLGDDLDALLSGDLDAPSDAPSDPPPVVDPSPSPSDPSTEVGMWYCEPREGIEAFDSDISRLSTGGINVLESWDAGEIYQNSKGTPSPNWARHQGEGWAGWIKHLDASAPPNLSTQIFKPIYGPVTSGKRKLEAIEEMARIFVEEGGTENPKRIAGICLGDDFAKYGYSPRWDALVGSLGEILGMGEATRFYITNQMYDEAIYSHGSPNGSKMGKLGRWITPFKRLGFKCVYLPQYYPWVGNEWKATNPTKWEEWLERGLKEIVALQKRFYPETLEILPILQASAWQYNRGPTKEDMVKQIETSLAIEEVTGVWLIGWNNPSFPSLPVFWDASDNWETGRNYAEAVREAIG